MAVATSLVWLRRDLRLTDNPALSAALRQGRPVLLLYILDQSLLMRPGGASLWWLERSLADLGRRSAALGVSLVLRRGPARDILESLCRDHTVRSVYWNRLYEPGAIARDKQIKAALQANGVECQSFNGQLLHEPWTVKTATGSPLKVFSAFWRACMKAPPPARALDAPTHITGAKGVGGDRLDDWRLYPGRPDWASAWGDIWSPGEEGAQRTLANFFASAAATYAQDRDRPDRAGTSRLSPHLSFGEISPRQIWHAAQNHLSDYPQTAPQMDKFLSEVGWREFSYHLLYYHPHLPEQPLRPAFAHFPWRDDPVGLRAWQRGLTGYPIVDAGMRELWATGYMHNRVRMIVASFLIKDLMISWRTGAAWFWDTLCDADLANNSASWQWVAGCGADAAPYFRIFNPILQGEKFDPQGSYVRRWVPELAALPHEVIHKPWQASPGVLDQAGVKLGHDYPRPIVDHARARHLALAAYQALKGKK